MSGVAWDNEPLGDFREGKTAGRGAGRGGVSV